MLIPTLVSKVLNGQTIMIEGNPGLRINPIYIDDVIRVFDPALQIPRSDLFNVAGDEIVTITDLVKLIEKVSGKRALLHQTDVNPGGDLVGDNTRMKEVLGVYPKTLLIEGLRQMP
jgi:nucleoside-diphosphate-sugar epimerase